MCIMSNFIYRMDYAGLCERSHDYGYNTKILCNTFCHLNAISLLFQSVYSLCYSQNHHAVPFDSLRSLRTGLHHRSSESSDEYTGTFGCHAELLLFLFINLSTTFLSASALISGYASLPETHS